jgi:hypothetical protein
MRTKQQRFVLPATDLIVLSDCKGDHLDRLIVQQHRYFAFGGSFDWYWLYDAGGKEISPVGEFANASAVLDDLAASGQCDR